MTLPHYAVGRIGRGFQRGSELGIPTANYELNVVKQLPQDFRTGIYCGYASIDNGEIYQMVMSVGWNPFFDNKERSMETHILHKFAEPNLYGRVLKVCITTFLRTEANFTTVENLVAAINQDIVDAKAILEQPQFVKLKASPFFSDAIPTEITTQNGNAR